ncbi:MAG: HAMP domain-containing histidine kinase [Thermoguttaceae bacterium]|nr:HAMP domain-containing histidine kinase [Thermoguttaceae bacterium]MDW8037682.1 HAMP domain-containing sensor histidine kinase [Thermoguttaceae bacterium]
MGARWAKLLGAAALMAIAGGVGFWQYHEYQHEAQLARTALQRQAEALYHAVVGGIRSHRRLGRFIELQIQAALEELTQTEDVLAVAVCTSNGTPILTAGQKQLLPSLPRETGFMWRPEALVYINQFTLSGDSGFRGPGGGPWRTTPGQEVQTPTKSGGPGGNVSAEAGRFVPKSTGPRWATGEKIPHGPGSVGGVGPKYGWGRGVWQDVPTASESLLAAGGQFLAVLVLDRSGTDAYVRRAGRLRFWLAGAGMGLIFCGLLAGWSVLRLLQARSRAQLLEMEARHLRELSQAAAGLAHQTRHPLGLLRGWAQRLAQADLQSEEARQRAQALMEECDRLTACLNQFLAFARPRDPEPEPVHLAELLRELEILLQPDWEGKDLRFRYHLPHGQQFIEADRDMLRQALFNLLQNAIQASPEGGEIEIRLTQDHDGRYRLSVADQGPGVPEEDQPKLFTPYFTTRQEGTGLGLAMVRRIATAHGWQVGYQRRPEGGSVFWMAGLRGCG